MKLLPVTRDAVLKNPKWSYLYISNLRVLRNIFVYAFRNNGLTEERLYSDMADGKIAAPKTKWVNEGVLRKERLRLEYVHAALYLNLIKREGGVLRPNLNDFAREKELLIAENQNRDLSLANPFSTQEQEALFTILMSYERARDFLWWFIDSERESAAVTLKEYRSKASPVFFPSQTTSEFRGSEVLRKGGVDYAIPREYIRLANTFFPGWFTDLGVIDTITVFPESSQDGKTWRMCYPIREIPHNDDFKKNVRALLGKEDRVTVSIPTLIYYLANTYGYPLAHIKDKIESLYAEDSEHFYLQRTSLQMMRNRSKYKNSYLHINGFYYSSLILVRGDSNG